MLRVHLVQGDEPFKALRNASILQKHPSTQLTTKRAQIQYHDGYDTTNDWLTPASAITITKSSQESKRAFEKIALYKGSPLFINISRYSQIDLSKSIDSVQH
jgi:hypothetical protein